MKVLAFYLPQYHRIKENDEWWGEGYTEWTAVKQAKSIFKGHLQPRVPMNNNYYDLSDETAKAWKWQAELAKKNKIDGFVIYHYWFETNKQLLEKPMEILLSHPEIDVNYCICWANETWTRTWYGLEQQVLIRQKYGDKEEWIKHFNYLLPFFKDSRYIKLDGKVLINIYHTAEIQELKEMLALWDSLAIENGLKGIYVVSGKTTAVTDYRSDLFDAYYRFEPAYTLKHKYGKKIKYKMSVGIRSLLNKIFPLKMLEHKINTKKFVSMMFDDTERNEGKTIPCIFPHWDNTPRRKHKGTVFFGTSIELFKKQLLLAKEKYSDSDFIYINAWNEWGEGAFLEPDEIDGDDYLKVIKDNM